MIRAYVAFSLTEQKLIKQPCIPNILAMFRHDKHLALIFLTRILTPLAHLYSPGGWLRMHIVLLPPLSQLTLNKPSKVYLCAKISIAVRNDYE